MNRATKEIKVGENTVEIYTYATGREFNQIQSVYMEDAKVNIVGNVTKIDGFDPNSELKASTKAIELLVVSINGSKENVADQIQDLPYAEFDIVMEAVNELIGKKKAQ